MSKRMKAREESESKENLPMKETEAPEGRLQSEQQVANTMSAASVDPGDQPGIVMSEDKIPAQVVHTTKVAEILKSNKGLTSGGSSGSGVAGYRSASYSGDAVIGDMSATTQLQEADRKASRTGRKLDSTLKHINYLYNEQVTVKYDESKPLAENPDATQGYNGTYRNEHARTQKNSGYVPGELYYDRSVDEIHQDFVYPVMGQSINDPYAESVISSVNTSKEEDASAYVDFDYDRGNHLHQNLVIAFDASGKLTKFQFTGVNNIGVTEADFDIVNNAATNSIIDANTAELDRQKVDANAGDELSPKFSPLPRSIKAPTATFSLLRDIEAGTGSELFMAYKKSAMAMSYQLNKAAKDGQRIKAPMYEMISGCMNSTSAIYDKTIVGSVEDTEQIFTEDMYRNGSPSLMIALYDSVSKYSTKGDLLLQPRGFRMHLQTADNNMNPLRVPKNFVNAVNTNEVFSTIDHEYDPFLPVCISDKATLAHPISLNSFINNNAPIAFRYSYSNSSNNAYITEVYHPLVKGLYDWAVSMGTKFASIFKDKATGDIIIPCIHSTTSFSLWSLILLAATPFIIKARLTSLIDVFDYEENFGYPFSQLISLAEANPMYSKNYVNNDYNEPITVKQMLPAVAFKWVFPESYWVVQEGDTDAQIVLPWYHNENQYEFNSENKMVLRSDGQVMSFPSVRSGSRFGFLDTIYGMTERDVRLCLDRQVVYPAYKMNKNTAMKTYKYGVTTDGQPVCTFNNSDFTIKAILSTPRELGWVIPVPNGVLTQYVSEFEDAATYKASRLALTDAFENYTPGFFRIKIWKGIPSTTSLAVDDILDASSININRAMSLQQKFYTIVCQRSIGSYNEFVNRDMIFSIASLFNSTDSGPALKDKRSIFAPFMIDGIKSVNAKDNIASFQKYFWTRVQRLPFAINPFDCAAENKALGKEDSIKGDPYDFLYIFGCAGFRASDFNEDSYNREKERLNLGMLFVEDPYFLESPLYRA